MDKAASMTVHFDYPPQLFNPMERLIILYNQQVFIQPRLSEPILLFSTGSSMINHIGCLQDTLWARNLSVFVEFQFESHNFLLTDSGLFSLSLHDSNYKTLCGLYSPINTIVADQDHTGESMLSQNVFIDRLKLPQLPLCVHRDAQAHQSTLYCSNTELFHSYDKHYSVNYFGIRPIKDVSSSSQNMDHLFIPSKPTCIVLSPASFKQKIINEWLAYVNPIPEQNDLTLWTTYMNLSMSKHATSHAQPFRYSAFNELTQVKWFPVQRTLKDTEHLLTENHKMNINQNVVTSSAPNYNNNATADLSTTATNINNHHREAVNNNPVLAKELVQKYESSVCSELLNHTTIVNLSDFNLQDYHVSLLSKGLTFCPTPGEPDMGEMRKDLDRFH